MTANLLEQVIPGPLVDGFDGEAIVVNRVTAQTVATIHVGPMESRLVTAKLFALALDHALWGAAAMASVCAITGKNEIVVYLGGKAPPPRFGFTLDAFRCPALTLELRAALKTALGLESR